MFTLIFRRHEHKVLKRGHCQVAHINFSFPVLPIKMATKTKNRNSLDPLAQIQIIAQCYSNDSILHIKCVSRAKNSGERFRAFMTLCFCDGSYSAAQLQCLKSFKYKISLHLLVISLGPLIDIKIYNKRLKSA